MDFIPDWHIFLQFTGASIILTLIPGPDMALFVGRSIAQGKSAGFAAIAGCCSGIFMQVIAVSIGLSALVTASPLAFFILKIAGSLYLLWLAFQAIYHGSSFNLAGGVRKVSLKRHYLDGLSVNLLNPKVLLFNLTFLPQFVVANDPHAAGKIIFLGLSFIPISLPFTVAMVFAANRFAAMLKSSPRIIRLLDWLMAGVFTAFALRLLLAQAK